MEKVLYITNIEVPYKVRFFNELAKRCDLTVIYERQWSSNRNRKWTNSENKRYKTLYLNGFNVGNECSFSFRILKYLKIAYDHIIISCYSSPVQIFAMLAMKCMRKSFTISLDGEVFISDSFRSRIKKFCLKLGKDYLAAGKKSAENIRKIVGNKRVIEYNFSSLCENELKLHRRNKHSIANNCFLVIGQYFNYKGLDVAVKVALKDPEHTYKFVGMGLRTEAFINECETNKIDNIEVVPFLSKKQLMEEYKSCIAMILPSRQECWGLVINEAASFGTPIISTVGSGAALEFIQDEYSQYLAKTDDAGSLYECISCLLQNKEIQNYSNFLIEKSKEYSIESSVNRIIEYWMEIK